MSGSSIRRSGFVRTVALGCGAIACASVIAVYFLEQSADRRVARTNQPGATGATRTLAALPRPQQQSLGSWFFSRRTDPSAVSATQRPKIGNAITNPELGMPR
jgi:hypothetical protein